jgi:protein-disulfide isomerase
MSGKQSKRQRRESAATQAAHVSRKASPKVILAAALMILLGAIGVGLAAAFHGGSSSPATTVAAKGSLKNAIPGAADVRKLFRGISQSGNVLGHRSAPVTMVEYADLQCPYCRDFETQAMPSLVTDYVRSGKVKLELRPLAFIGPDSVRGRNALIAAGNQQKLFDLMELFYINQGTENTGWLSEDLVRNAAASIPGLDVTKMLDDRKSSAVEAKASAFDAAAQDAAVTSTPTILVGKSGGKLHLVTLSSPSDGNSVAKAIEGLLART